MISDSIDYHSIITYEKAFFHTVTGLFEEWLLFCA